LRSRKAEDQRSVRAAGVMMSLAALVTLCWAGLAALAITGAISAATAILIAVGGYLLLAALVCALIVLAPGDPPSAARRRRGRPFARLAQRRAPTSAP
jgi:hypothetical protein